MSQAGLLVRLADSPPDLSQLLFMEEVSSRLLLFQLGSRYLRHAARPVAFGPKSSARIHMALCAKRLFHPFSVSSNITNKGKSSHSAPCQRVHFKKVG